MPPPTKRADDIELREEGSDGCQSGGSKGPMSQEWVSVRWWKAFYWDSGQTLKQLGTVNVYIEPTR